MARGMKQEFCCVKEQTKEQYAFTVFLTCPQQTDQMLWWCDYTDERKLTF